MKKTILIVLTIALNLFFLTTPSPTQAADSCTTCGTAGAACCPFPCGVGSCLDGSICGGIGICPSPECSNCGGPGQPCCNTYCISKVVTLGSGGCKTASYACSGSENICIVPTPTVAIPTPVGPTSPIATVAPPDPTKCQPAVTGSCPSGFPIGCGGSRPGYCCKTDIDCRPYPTAPPAPSSFCDTATGTDHGIKTALGCLDITGQTTISTLLNWGVSIGGGIAFVMILVAAFQINTSRGDAKRVAAARELLFSALAGIFLIAISVVLLNFIGISVLGLDKFGFATQ